MKYLYLSLILLFAGCAESETTNNEMGKLQVSENGRFFVHENGEPFFWLGDTGWLLFSKLTKEDAEIYLQDRKDKGFNVIQVMVLHNVNAVNIYGDSALINGDVSRPNIEELIDNKKLSYWQFVDYVVDLAAEKGLYMALVPVWGTNVKNGWVTEAQAIAYADFLAKRYRERPNIIWLNGGDIKGSDSTRVWQSLGKTLRKEDPNHLITFHPRGRTTSTEWFHNEEWLDFNMFQSGHRRYDQDTSSNETNHYGEDNWRYVVGDYALKPAKPTIDAEPSYEGIPQGLHDINEPVWTDRDVRRYAYWSVFAGAFGYTYGQNSVMQMHSATDTTTAYGSDELWTEAIHAPGASQMKYLKNLMLSRSFLDRVPDQSLVAENGERYYYKVGTRGHNYALIYTYTGGKLAINMGKIDGDKVKASWFNPRTGELNEIGDFNNEGRHVFQAPGEEEGNDWVLILDSL